MEEITRKWVERAKYDFLTAKAMLDTRRYLYVAFMCQQCLEKTLKAIVIAHGNEAMRIHNLVRLAEEARIYKSLAKEDQLFLADLTPYVIEARYGDYKRKLSEIISKKMAYQYLKKTEEMFKWLKVKLKSIG